MFFLTLCLLFINDFSNDITCFYLFVHKNCIGNNNKQELIKISSGKIKQLFII